MRRRRSLVASAVLVLAALAGCGSGDGGGSGGEELTYLTPFSYILAYSDAMNAKTAGHFEAAGVDVGFEAAQGSAQALTQLLAGQADVARSDAVDVVNAVVSNDAPLKVIASITQQTPFYMISGQDDPVESAADMRGRTIGVISVGGATDNLVKVMLAQAGIAPDEVQVESVGSGAGSWGLIEQGRIDAFVDTSSSRVALESAGQPVTAWNISQEVALPSQVYVVTEQTLQEKPDALAKFLTGVRASMTEIRQSPDLQVQIDAMSGEFEIGDLGEGDQGVRSLKADSDLWAAAGEDQLLVNQEPQWTSGLDLLKSAGIVAEAPPVADLYTDDVYSRAFGA